ncbi:hypothetical protein [Prevotella corporis]|uniref:hypothetical protein n=1 Tax=Prevotella corporis TaxID=28128 RepID=UPI0023672FEC|nr:hypothetical protein [Prevotella corporis]
MFQKLSPNDRKILYKYVDDTVRTVIFGLLGIFEENEKYKIVYENNGGGQVDLNKISEMLKAELSRENGWIDRFSKYANKKYK